MIPDAPYVRLLIAAAAFVRAADYLAGAGVTQPVKVRHSRNRKAVRSEKPCITLIFVGDEPAEAEQMRNMGETVRELTLELQLDMDLATEDSDADPTGLAALGRVLAVAYRSLIDPNGLVFLGGLCDWVSPGSIDPDDKSTSDDGRLVRGVSVVYRVRSDDPNVLLSAGENG